MSHMVIVFSSCGLGFLESGRHYSVHKGSDTPFYVTTGNSRHASCFRLQITDTQEVTGISATYVLEDVTSWARCGVFQFCRA